MRKYKIKYSEIEDYSKESFMTMIESACRYANTTEYRDADVILAIIGIVPEKEEITDEIHDTES